ncbi:MAG TPA: ABC transporter ATP-binding protein [Leptospiraceae bacterium]|nr:ABC transporter ATP-binding protein [Leptospiraceae bacterium]
MSLQVVNLKKTYKNPLSRKPPFEAVRGVSFEIKPGEIYALIGPNGAGKSTIIKMIAGLIVPSSGDVMLDGKKLGSETAAYKKLSAVLEGTRNVYWRLTPLENLHYFANLRGISTTEIREKSVQLLKTLEIEGKKKNQSQHLSRGMLQKLALGAALITDPQIILLDEPTLGLDVGSSRKIKEMMLELTRKHGKSILLTTHQMDLVEEVADRAGIIREGKIVREGTIPELRNVFRNHIYRFSVRGKFKLPPEWQKKYGAALLSGQNDHTEWEMDCKKPEGLYTVLSALGKKKLQIISMHKPVEDLEEIFMRTLSEEATR